MISQNFELDLFAIIVFFPFPKSNNYCKRSDEIVHAAEVIPGDSKSNNYGKRSDDTVHAAEVIPGDSKRNNYGKGSDDTVHDQRSAFASG